MGELLFHLQGPASSDSSQMLFISQPRPKGRDWSEKTKSKSEKFKYANEVLDVTLHLSPESTQQSIQDWELDCSMDGCTKETGQTSTENWTVIWVIAHESMLEPAYTQKLAGGWLPTNKG